MGVVQELVKRKVIAPAKKVSRNEATQRTVEPMTYSERQQLGLNIKHLTTKQLKGVVQIMQEGKDAANQEVLEFDLNTLDDSKCRSLEAYVLKCHAAAKKQTAKAKPQKKLSQGPIKNGQLARNGGFEGTEQFQQIGLEMGSAFN